jgi:transposase
MLSFANIACLFVIFGEPGQSRGRLRYHERLSPLALQAFITGLLPSTHKLRLTEVTVEDESVRLQLTATAPTACCPCCTAPSSSVHGRYQRHLTDLPWGPRAVRIQLSVWKFVCRNRACARRIFTERLSDLVAAYARKTHRLIAVLRAIGIALGGQTGARLAARLHLPTSPATLIQTFLAIVRERRGGDLETWMAEATHSGVTELVRFAHGLQDDLIAIKAGLTLAWSNGVTEGQIHRLKLVKRQGYGRAGFALLRQRVLQAA